MSLGIASLHKILKDETRRKIILLLNEKDSLSYTELLEATKAGSTGNLNYHLKVLGDLLNKNEAGQYQLSEKGKLAFRLTVEFPEEINEPQKRKRIKLYWGSFAIINAAVLVSLFIFYFLGYIDFARLIQGIIANGGVIGTAYFGYKVQIAREEAKRSGKTTMGSHITAAQKEESPKQGPPSLLSPEVRYAIVCACLVVPICYLGGLTIIGMIPRILGVSSRVVGTPFLIWFAFSFTGAPIIAAIVGYYYGKRKASKEN
jgi:DNA-binding transcriptional ArsR family regulator